MTDPRAVLAVESLDWQTDAACRGTLHGFTEATTHEDAAPLLSYCRRCPVVVECAELGRQTPDRDGVWGGVAFSGGKPVRPPKPPRPVVGWRNQFSANLQPCGTRAAARRHERRGELLDPACLAARAAYDRRLNRRRTS